MAVGRSETTEREESSVERAPPTFALRWVWPECRTFPLRGARLGVGRDEASSIRLHGGGVSRRHAELYRQGPLYVVRDLGSTNGTWLGGRRIEHAPVQVGDVMRVGDWVGVFSSLTEPASEFCELAPGLRGGPELAAALAPLRRAATDDLPLLLVGETGAGKERFARAVHHFSGRSGPFFAINCAALPEHLAEAELFGYRKGAFTGAERANHGYFRSAHGGTLFLDEVAELRPSLQAKLLRVLEDGLVLGLGESVAVEVDVRIVSAAPFALADAVQARGFRQDLAARLAGLVVVIPTLAERRADVAGLFRFFLGEYSGGRPPEVQARLVEALCLHDWPQNVRELELTTRGLLAVHGHEPTLRRQHLPPHLAGAVCDDALAKAPARPPRPRSEHDLARLELELERNGGNVTAAAASLGISRQRVYRLLNERSSTSPPAGNLGGKLNEADDSVGARARLAPVSEVG